VFSKILYSHPKIKEKNFVLQTYLDLLLPQVDKEVFSLEKPYTQLNFPYEGGVTGYFSRNMTPEDLKLIREVLIKEKKSIKQVEEKLSLEVIDNVLSEVGKNISESDVKIVLQKIVLGEKLKDAIKKEKIDLARLVEELHALMLPAIESKKLQFELKLEANLPPIISDRSKLKRLLLNLLSNAVKFTKKGKISLEIGLLGLENNQAQIEMRIIDTGIGIPKDNLDKLFDCFYRAHPSYSAEYKGYGIGLYLVKKSLGLLGGDIKVDSEEGKGSCFTLEFNFCLAEKDRKKTVFTSIDITPEIDKNNKIKETVLIAEDNDLVLYAVKNMLIKLGYEVTAVSEGKAALEALKNRSFSWVLLDIGLPDLGGLEVTRLYRKWEQENNKAHLPIFALTAHAEDEVIEKYKKMGIDRVLTKPFTENDINTIKKFIEK
jgi:CheY-like chemotaxis protein